MRKSPWAWRGWEFRLLGLGLLRQRWRLGGRGLGLALLFSLFHRTHKTLKTRKHNPQSPNTHRHANTETTPCFQSPSLSPPAMLSILANSHSLLHSGHTFLVFNHLWMQSRWKTWPQQPHAIESPGKGERLRTVGEDRRRWRVYILILTCHVGIAGHSLILDRRLVQWVPANCASVCTDIPRPGHNRAPLLDLCCCGVWGRGRGWGRSVGRLLVLSDHIHTTRSPARSLARSLARDAHTQL